MIIMGGGYLFYVKWSQIKAEQYALEQAVLIQQKKAESAVKEQQEKRRVRDMQAEAEDVKTLQNVRIVDGLVKKYYEKAGYVPSMAGHLSLVGQGIGFASTLRSGEVEPRIMDVLYVWKGGNTYALCADFKTDILPVGTSEEWKHTSGSYCFPKSMGPSVIEEIKSSL